MGKMFFYKLNSPINIGTEEEPNWKDNFIEKGMSYSEANLEIVKREAYNGEYTVEDDGEPEVEIVTTDDILNALLGVTE